MALHDQILVPAVMHAAASPRTGRIAQADVCCDLIWTGGRLLLSGPQSTSRRSRLEGQAFEVLNIDPLVARAWLGFPLAALTDQQAPLADLKPEAADRLSELFQAGKAARLVRRVGARLAPLLDPRLAEAARLLRRHGSVRLAAESVGLSERQLERLFQDRFGLAPKRYASILRMRRAIRAASNGLSLADAALEAGYVDQAHFNRDVRILAGATPGALIPNVGVSQDKRVETRDY